MGEFDKQAGNDGDTRTDAEIIAEKERAAGMEQQGGKEGQQGGKEEVSDDQGDGGQKPQG